MNTGSSHDNQKRSNDLPSWKECDFFCIHDYAGTGATPCGWRGRVHEARYDAATRQFFCPGCGCASLLRIPLDPTGRTEPE